MYYWYSVVVWCVWLGVIVTRSLLLGTPESPRINNDHVIIVTENVWPTFEQRDHKIFFAPRFFRDLPRSVTSDSKQSSFSSKQFSKPPSLSVWSSLCRHALLGSFILSCHCGKCCLWLFPKTSGVLVAALLCSWRPCDRNTAHYYYYYYYYPKVV